MHIVTLRDPSSAVEARFVPAAGMIGVSLTDSGEQLLAQRHGLDAYVADAKTMGIPILYPWANRLGANTYTVEGQTVTVWPGSNRVRPDPNGLPIHGVLAAYPGWRVTSESANELAAEVDFGADAELLASFPFPHMLTLTVRLAERTLSVRAAVTSTGDTAVPLCFGFHPYLQLPDIPRQEWVIETPPLRHLSLDERGLPAGAVSDQLASTEPLVDKTFDDGYDMSPTARCSRYPAVGAVSKCISTRATQQRRSSRPRVRMWCVSSRWPGPPMRCAAAATNRCSPASRRSPGSRSGSAELLEQTLVSRKFPLVW
jgi:galactose mutarotase-like enzyme